MLNHKTIFKQKSKILLTILCIFGLAFSYSCSCRADKVTGSDPTVFSISTSSVETRLVQKADGSGFNYQPSIKFIEANGNQFTVSYEVTDKDTANKIDKTNVTYKDGLITFDKTEVLDKLTITKKSITITFTVKANDTTLQNPETNFTINVDLKKTAGTITAQDKIGTTIKNIFSHHPEGYPFTLEFKNEASDTSITAEAAISGSNNDKGKVEYSKRNFTDSLKNRIEKEKTTIGYKSIVLESDASGGTGLWSFYFKFTFSDEDYDLTDAQKNGIDYRIDVKMGDANNPISGTWVEFI